MRNILGPGLLTHKPCRRKALEMLQQLSKGGRPKRSHSTFDDVELIQLMQGHSRMSCMWSAQWKQPIQVLNKSLKAAYKTDGALQTRIKYRTLVDRLKYGRLPIGRAHRDTDKCDVCQAWDHNSKAKVIHVLRKWRLELQGQEAMHP